MQFLKQIRHLITEFDSDAQEELHRFVDFLHQHFPEPGAAAPAVDAAPLPQPQAPTETPAPEAQASAPEQPPVSATVEPTASTEPEQPQQESDHV